MHSHGNIDVNCTFLDSCSFHFFSYILALDKEVGEVTLCYFVLLVQRC
jgi:hypothetical protein